MSTRPRDERFWIWFACVPARDLILSRYGPPTKLKDKEGCPKSPLPGTNNFFGSSGRETLPFRFWIRGEMGFDVGDPERYRFVVPGKIDFWRSHVFRQLFAHHRPFLKAWINFQFPDPDRPAKLNTEEIRLMARELAQSCATVCVEALDQEQCASMVRRVYRERVEKPE